MATTNMFPKFGSELTQSRVLHAVKNVRPQDGVSAPPDDTNHSGSGRATETNYIREALISTDQ